MTMMIGCAMKLRQSFGAVVLLCAFAAGTAWAHFPVEVRTSSDDGSRPAKFFDRALVTYSYNALTPIAKSDICRALPDVSPTTVEAVLGAMVRNGKIRKVGKVAASGTSGVSDRF